MNIKQEDHKALSNFMLGHMNMGHTLSAVKGKPPTGTCWDDGTTVDEINVAWVVNETGERFDIKYIMDDEEEDE